MSVIDWPEEGVGGCIASRLVASGEEPIRFFYRDEPVDEVDTGWCFLSGIETDEEMEDPDSQVILDLRSAVELEPAILPFLDAPTGSAFERGEGGDFERVTDWSPNSQDD
ncbi:DUF2185 domain-containing protein [Aliihoeflea aestuarii]|jgi:hypothetical protein|uniref:DUF2185 domain-containing protein n=1 Tax=Aliihoeflea aestuarii TaxID=453840 RepID=UPI002093492C|nr:DUF2185 domain-containing protein [Aliihoeflea aestuarii]MCO6391954.1 DUF2185 domain-containing protein [Aliihoeflea aestuarii]